MWYGIWNDKLKKNMDISILGKEPILDKMVILTITPLAPLSMVSDMPGSYYKTLKVPNKKILCGLIENIIGWKFSNSVRDRILQAIKRRGISISKNEHGSTYKPLLMEYFDIVETPLLSFDSVCFYDDLWARNHSRRKDSAIEHAHKCRNISKELFQKLHSVDPDKNEVKKLSPNYYPVLPTRREYVDYKNGNIIYKLQMDENLFVLLQNSLSVYNIGYLGNSEGWVNLNVTNYD